MKCPRKFKGVKISFGGQTGHCLYNVHKGEVKIKLPLNCKRVKFEIIWRSNRALSAYRGGVKINDRTLKC